ncbi:hypothetical protein GCM10027155_19020 [Acinetobacter apis]|uniref:Uncharacterized protein n=1 Tax=Acinetobacter apis TaxID=1229165 RepID=A0A217EFU1_9GAMM|nr:hypothetical protein [Acinetobacter apis]SNQ29358.1 hypothetical protein SAMN05444584_1306 [Acinetobacter apis]
MSRDIIERIGATDQLYLEENSAELALERGELRLELVLLSQNKQEQTYFLHEAIAILEQARIEFEEIAVQLYIQISLELVRAYMLYYEISKEIRFATITQQILKPISHLQDAHVYFMLAYAHAVKDEVAMTRHWLNKYSTTDAFDLQGVKQHPAFQKMKDLTWFQTLLQQKMH